MTKIPATLLRVRPITVKDTDTYRAFEANAVRESIVNYLGTFGGEQLLGLWEDKKLHAAILVTLRHQSNNPDTVFWDFRSPKTTGTETDTPDYTAPKFVNGVRALFGAAGCLDMKSPRIYTEVRYHPNVAGDDGVLYKTNRTIAETAVRVLMEHGRFQLLGVEPRDCQYVLECRR